MNNIKDYAEVRCSYCNEDGYWTIDAWKTSDNEEEGAVVAVINDKTAEIYYIDALARISKRVQKIIADKVAELKKKNERKDYVLFYCNENMQTDMERYATLADAQAAMQVSFKNSLENNFADRDESYIDYTTAYIQSNNYCEIWEISAPLDPQTHTDHE